MRDISSMQEKNKLCSMSRVEDTHVNFDDVEVAVHTPEKFDVLLGRGRWYSNHPGNRRLQILINMHLERYQVTKSRPEKTFLTNEILYMVKVCGRQPGRFLKFEAHRDGWVTVDDEIARIKISQAMRYTIRAPQVETAPTWEQGCEMSALMEQDTTPHSIGINVEIPKLLKVVVQSTNPEMGPPPSRFRSADDSRCNEASTNKSGGNRKKSREILSDKAIWMSLGYDPPF